MNIPERYKDAKYEDVPESVKNCLKKMFPYGRGIYMHGTVGTGKTHILWAIMKHIDEQNEKEHTRIYYDFWNTTRLLYEIREEYNHGKYKNYDTYGTMRELLES